MRTSVFGLCLLLKESFALGLCFYFALGLCFRTLLLLCFYFAFTLLRVALSAALWLHAFQRKLVTVTVTVTVTVIIIIIIIIHFFFNPSSILPIRLLFTCYSPDVKRFMNSFFLSYSISIQIQNLIEWL